MRPPQQRAQLGRERFTKGGGDGEAQARGGGHQAVRAAIGPVATIVDDDEADDCVEVDG